MTNEVTGEVLSTQTYGSFTDHMTERMNEAITSSETAYQESHRLLNLSQEQMSSDKEQEVVMEERIASTRQLITDSMEFLSESRKADRP